MLTSQRLFAQLGRFGFVGIFATLLHAAVYLLLTTILSTHGFVQWALVANSFAFVVAFLFAFVGHRMWTFRERKGPRGPQLRRFAVLAALGFVCNSFFTWLLVERLRLPAASPLICMLFITPPLTFFAARTWVFVEMLN